MRDHSHHIELSREEAVERILARFEPIPGKELVPVGESFGRVLAEDVLAREDMPNCLTCALDSVAVHWADFEQGMPDTSDWVRGVDWQFANTGVAMPQGFDTAVVIEHVEVSDDEQHIKIQAAPSEKFAGTRPAGSKMKVGDLLASAGAVVTPELASRIASGNVTTVPVVVRPKVAFIPTGNELVPAGGAHVPTGKNIETNSILVAGKVAAWGAQLLPFDVVPDDPQVITAAVAKACGLADIVVLNAGSSKGSDDWSIEQLEEMGEVICHQTNHGPGHHSSFAVVDGVPVVGISGPPGGAAFTLDFYLRPLIRKFLGLDPAPEFIPVMLTREFPGGGHDKKPASAAPKGEERPREAMDGSPFFSIRFLHVEHREDGTLQATPVPGAPGSVALDVANAYYMMPSGVGYEKPKAGDIIYVEMR